MAKINRIEGIGRVNVNPKWKNCEKRNPTLDKANKNYDYWINSKEVRAVVWRQVVYRYLRYELKQTTTAIGTFLGKDHSTVLHAMQNYENLKNDETLTKIYTDFEIEYNFKMIKREYLLFLETYDKSAGRTTARKAYYSMANYILHLKDSPDEKINKIRDYLSEIKNILKEL